MLHHTEIHLLPRALGSVPANSMVAVRLDPDLLTRLRTIEVVEHTFTPGNLLREGTLQRWQTTRLP